MRGVRTFINFKLDFDIKIKIHRFQKICCTISMKPRKETKFGIRWLYQYYMNSNFGS